MEKKEYEAVLVFRGELDEAAVNGQIDRVDGIVKSHGGEVKRRDIWGRRQLAYRIGKRESGVYSLLVFDGDNSLVSDLERQLKINEAVLRHSIVRKNKFAPDLQPGRRMDEEFNFGSAAGDDDDFGSADSQT